MHAQTAGGDGLRKPSGIGKYKSKSNLVQPKNYRFPRDQGDNVPSEVESKLKHGRSRIPDESPIDDADQIPPSLIPGSRVCVAGVKHGTLRYFGKTLFADGYWCGIELDEPEGKNNGTVDGVSYFTCTSNHGLFAPPEKVVFVPDSPDARQEDACSLPEAFSMQSTVLSASNTKPKNVGLPRVRKLPSPKVTVKRKAEQTIQKTSDLNSEMDCTYNLNHTFESQPKIQRKAKGIPLPVSVGDSKENYVPEMDVLNKTLVRSDSSNSDFCSVVDPSQTLMLDTCMSCDHKDVAVASPRAMEEILNKTFDIELSSNKEMASNQTFDRQYDSYRKPVIEPLLHSGNLIHQPVNIPPCSQIVTNVGGLCDVTFCTSGDQDRCMEPPHSHNETFVTDSQSKGFYSSQDLPTNQLSSSEGLALSRNLRFYHSPTKAAPFSPNLTFIQEPSTGKTPVSKTNDTEIYSLPNSPEYKFSKDELELLTSAGEFRKLNEMSERSLLEDYPFPDIIPSENCENEDLVYGYGRQGSFDLDDSLGILTPNQMKDFTIFTESSVVKTPSIEDVQELCDDAFDDSIIKSQTPAVKITNDASPNKIAELTFFDQSTSTPNAPPSNELEKAMRGIIQESVPSVHDNISFFPLNELCCTPWKPTIEDHLKDLSSIIAHDDQHLFQSSLHENCSKDSFLVGSSSKMKRDKPSVESADTIIDTVVKNRSMDGSTIFNCSLNDQNFNSAKPHAVEGIKIGFVSRESNFQHVIANKSASDIADRLLVGVMNESVKEVVATCSDPFNYNFGKTENANHGCEFQGVKDHSMTEYLMQQMGPNFCDQISEKKDRPMSALTVSVTSIDTGYQGDAECDVHSAAASAINTPVEEPKKAFGSDDRDNALYPAEGLCVLRHPKADVGSDSDFCSDMGTSWTESELENEEKIRGRCARVIDGTLYFNDNEIHEKSVCVKEENLSNVINDCVSVAENIPDQLQQEKAVEENTNENSGSDESGTLDGKDMEMLDEKVTDEDTLKCGYSISLENAVQDKDCVEATYAKPIVAASVQESVPLLNNLKENFKSQTQSDEVKTAALAEKRRSSPKAGQVLNNTASLRKKPRDDASVKSKLISSKEGTDASKTSSRKPVTETSNASPGKSDADTEKVSPGRTNSFEKSKSSPRKSETGTPKKPKTPKKNVMSKIKAMIEATSCKVVNDEETSEEFKKPLRTPKKSRWEAVMSKIAAGQAEEKAKGKPIREVRSKIATTWTAATKSPPKKPDDSVDKSTNRYSSGSNRSQRSTRRASRTASDSANPEEGADDTVSINSSNRSSHSDLSASQQSLSKIPSKSRLPRVPPTATSHKSERPCSPSQMSDISTMSAASHLSAASHGSHTSHVSGRVLPRSSIATSHAPPRGKDGVPNTSKAAPVTSKVRQNNARNLSGSSRNVVSATAGSKTSSPLANSTATAKRQRATNASSPNTTQNRTSTVSPRVVSKPPVPSRVVAPAKTLPARPQPLKEQNRIRNLKTAPTALRSGNQQPDILNTSAASNKVEVCKEISRLEALCETHTKDNGSLKTKLDQCAIGFEALTMVVKYMVDELDAFSNPYLVRDVRILQVQLERIKSDFEEALKSKEVLETKITDLVKTHELEVESLKTKQLQELENVQTTLSEIHQKELNEARETFENSEVQQKEIHKSELDKILAHQKSRQSEIRLRHEEEIGKLAELHRLQVEGIKKEHSSLVESLKVQSEVLEGDLQKQIALLTEQCHELQQQKREFEDVILKDSDLKMQVARGKVAELNKEVDSLKTVVELRNKEIHDLRSSSSKIQKLEEELHISQEKVSLLTTRMEDLQAQVDIKNKRGRKLSTEHQVLKEWYERESKASKRLSMEKEELQWKLQQTIEGSPVHSGNVPDFTLMSNYSELDTMFAPVRTCGGDYVHDQSPKSSRFQNLSPIYSTCGKVVSPVMSRSSILRAKQRQRFSVCEADPILDNGSSAGVRYRRAASMSWTVGLDHGDAPDSLVSRMSLSSDSAMHQENESLTGPLNQGSGDHTPEKNPSEICDSSLPQNKVVTNDQLTPTLDERLQMAVNERLRAEENKELFVDISNPPCSEIDVQLSQESSQQPSPDLDDRPQGEILRLPTDVQISSKLQSHSEENLPYLESPVSEPSEKSEVSNEISVSSEKCTRHITLERRESSADARVPSLITALQLDEQIGASNKSRSTSAKRDRRDSTNSKRVSLTKCSSPKSYIRQQNDSPREQKGGKVRSMGNVVERPAKGTEVVATDASVVDQETLSNEKNTDYESFSEEISESNCFVTDKIEGSGGSQWESQSPSNDLEPITADASSAGLNTTFEVIPNSGASYISVDRSPCTFEELNRSEISTEIQPEVLCSSVDTIEFDCSVHTNIAATPHSYIAADESLLGRTEGDLLFDGLQNIFSCEWGNETAELVTRKPESSMVHSESGSSPSKSSLVITFKPQKLSGSSCDSSPPPEPMEMLQVSESSTSHSEESSPLPSPTFRSRPEDVTENLSCSYTMSPRTSAGEAMVLVDLSATLRQEPSRDTSGLLLRRTFHGQYLNDSISTCSSSLRVSAEACGKDSSSDDPSQQCNSKPATPESCSQAIAPTDSTNIDLSWSDDDEDDIPSESEV